MSSGGSAPRQTEVDTNHDQEVTVLEFVTAIIKPHMLMKWKTAPESFGVEGMTVSEASGWASWATPRYTGGGIHRRSGSQGDLRCSWTTRMSKTSSTFYKSAWNRPHR